jgi:hypothetical protein
MGIGAKAIDAAPPVRLRRVRADVVGLIGLLGVIVAFYVWTSATSLPIHFGQEGSGVYGEVADSLLHGQVSMREPAPDALLALPNSYDPVANQAFRADGLHDLSLRDGKIYAPFGPTPAIVLFAPLQLVGVWIPQSIAVIVFGAFGTIFCLLSLRFLVRRFLPSTPAWALTIAMLALALGNAVPWLLRRSEVYEVAISAGYCFAWLGIWLLITGWTSPQPTLRRIAGASAALGLAVCARPTWAVLALLPLLLAIGAWRDGRWPVRGSRRTTLLALGGPLALGLLLFLAYNMMRFGSPFELGYRYQLGGVDPALLHGFRAEIIGPGVFWYLVAPPRFLGLFPFVTEGLVSFYPWQLPKYYGLETTTGILATAPICLALAALPAVGRSWAPDLRRVTGALALAGLLMIVGLAFSVNGVTQRYEVDFASLLLLPAVVVWMALAIHVSSSRRVRRAALLVGGALLGWTILLGAFMSFTGDGDPLRTRHAATFDRLESVFSPVSVLLAGAAGPPLVGVIEGTPSVMDNSEVGPGSLSNAGSSFLVGEGVVTLRVAAAHSGRYVVRFQAGQFQAAAPPVKLEVEAQGEGTRVDVGSTAVPVVAPIALRRGITRVRFAMQPPVPGLLLRLDHVRVERR